MCPRLLIFVGMLAAWLAPLTARAAPPRARVSVVPALSGDGRVHERAVVGAHVETPILVSDPGATGDTVSVEARAVTRVRLSNAFGLSTGYTWRRGRYPLEGPWDQEHRGTIGVWVVTPDKGRLLGVTHRTRVEFRGVEQEDAWRFRVRLRTETALVLSFRPWMQMSLPVELLASPQAPRVDILQLRAGLGLGGSAPVGQREDAEEARPAARLRWLAAARAGLWPVALSEARGLPAAELDATQQAVDLVVTLGFGVSL